MTMPPPLPKIPLVAHPGRKHKYACSAAFAIAELALIDTAIRPSHRSATVALTALVFTFVLRSVRKTVLAITMHSSVKEFAFVDVPVRKAREPALITKRRRF
jgi:hypothetical protein